MTWLFIHRLFLWPATIYSVGLSGYKSIAQHTQIHLVAIGAPLASLDSHIDSRRLLKTLGAYDLQLQLFFRGSAQQEGALIAPEEQEG